MMIKIVVGMGRFTHDDKDGHKLRIISRGDRNRGSGPVFGVQGDAGGLSGFVTEGGDSSLGSGVRPNSMAQA